MDPPSNRRSITGTVKRAGPGSGHVGLAVAVPVLLAWIALLSKGKRPTWFLAPTLAAVAFGLWAEPLETVLQGPTSFVAARALSRVLLLVALPLGLLYVFGEGHLVPGPPAIGLGREDIPESLGYGVVAALAIVPVVAFALMQRGGADPTLKQAPFLVLAAVAEELFFRGILLVPLIGQIGRGGALAVSASSFVLTRPTAFFAAGMGFLPRPFNALALVMIGVLFGLVALRTRHAAGPALGRSIVRLVPPILV